MKYTVLLRDLYKLHQNKHKASSAVCRAPSMAGGLGKVLLWYTPCIAPIFFIPKYLALHYLISLIRFPTLYTMCFP